MGLGFLTLGDSINAVLCPACLTLSGWCVMRSKDGDVHVSPSACLDSCSVGFGAKRRACHLALKPGCLAQGASA